MALLTKSNTIIMLEGSRLQPGDVLDTSRPTHVRHQPYAGGKGKADEWMNQRPRAQSQESLERGIGRPFLAKGHVTSACAVP